MSNKTLDFIKKAKLKHGDKYSYNKTVYINGRSNVTITCPKHGDFFQTPSNHLKFSCRNCSKEERDLKVLVKAKSEFTEKIKLAHGDRYGLELIDYKGAKKKVKVICFEHGVFEITAQHLIAGSGCKKCGKLTAINKVKLKAQKEFQLKATKVHGPKYDYSEVVYKLCDTKVTIICPLHGKFTKTPTKHLAGEGCNICEGKAVVNRMTTESFIERANKTHNHVYDYSKTNYVKAHHTVIVICKKHGEFLQNPHNHLAGAGCKACADEKLIKSTAEFIKQANLKHRNKFDYTETDYVSHKTKVKITCSVHGTFFQTPSLHLAGSGCRKCSKEKQAQKLAHNTLKFIQVSQQIHDYKWNYSKTEYINNHTKVIINCDIHGDFYQTPGSHKAGRGCPECGKQKSIDSRKLSINEFVSISNDVHQYKYTYEFAEYQNNHEKVMIVCPEHGIFKQRPSLHMKGAGCSACQSKLRKMPRNEFIKKANALHEKKYTYCDLKYYSKSEKITITCSIHGDFLQRVDSHLQGSGCIKCNNEVAAFKKRIKTDEFIERSQLLHKNKYIYTNISCDGGNDIVEIYCPAHGPFKQKVRQHLRGSGCRKCYVESTRLTQEKFIEECSKHHKGRYDYSLVKYETIREPIIICCYEHGQFVQIAHEHRHGAGCPRCAEYYRNLDNKDPETPCYIYYLKLKFEDLIFYKIGITTKNIKHRFRALNKDSVTIEDEYSFLTTLHKAIAAEQDILFEFSSHKLLMNDILKNTKGGTECFADNVMEIYDLLPEDFI